MVTERGASGSAWRGVDIMSESSDKINEAVESVKGKITEFTENEKVQDAVGTAKEKLTEFTENEKVQGAVGTAKEKFGEIKDKLLGK